MAEVERIGPTQCPRCRKRDCTGRWSLMTCKETYDGKNGFDEAEELMRARYVAAESDDDGAAQLDEPAPQTPVVERPTEMVAHYGDDKIIPWDPKKDRRPKAKTAPRVGCSYAQAQVGGKDAGYGWFNEQDEFISSHSAAMWGECTVCVDKKGPIRAATWRRENRNGNTVASYCDKHALKVASAPIVVPTFDNAADAAAWLDKLTEETTR